MNSKEEVEIQLHNLQNNIQIFDIKLCGFSVWNILKRPIYRQITGIRETDEKNAKLNFKLSLIYIINIVISLLQTLFFAFKNKNKRNILFYFNSSRKFLFNGYYIDPYLDELYELYKKHFNVITIDNLKGRTKRKPYVVPMNINENIIKAPAIIPNLRYKKKINKTLTELKRFLTSHSKGNDIDEIINSLNSNYIRGRIHKFIREKKRAQIVLKLLKPKFIFVVSSEGHLAMIAAAKELHIKVIEQQHGLISAFHPIYDIPQKNTLINSCLCTPDYLFVYGEYWKKLLLNSGNWNNEDIICTGNNKFNIQTKHFKQTINSTEFILVYSSNSSLIKFEINFFAIFLKAADKQTELQVVIKLHPKAKNKDEWIGLMEMFSENLKVYLDSEVDIYDLYNIANAHLSAYSAAIYETIELKIPTFIFSEFSSADIQSLISKELIVVINNEYDLLSVISDKERINYLKSVLNSNPISFFSKLDINLHQRFINEE